MKNLFTPVPFSVDGILRDPAQYDIYIWSNEYLTLTTTIERFRSNSHFNQLISAVLNDTDLLNRCLENSYRHHNGFHKIVLSKGASFKLRLHVFTNIAEINQPMENVHNHRWNFSSRIIKGSLKMQILKQSKHSSSIFYEHDYIAAENTENHSLISYGLTPLVVQKEKIFQKGESYYMDSKVLHRVIHPQNEKVITLAMTGTPNNSKCKLYSNNAFSEDQNKFLRYEKNDLTRILENL